MARRLNGTSDFISLGYSVTSPNGSLNFWIRPTGSPGNNDVILGQNASADGNLGLGFQFRTTSKIVAIVAQNETGLSADIDTSGVWTHLGMSWGDGGVVLYVNGVSVGTNAYAGAPSVTAGYAIELGAFNYSGGRLLFPPMDVAEFGLWDASLTALEFLNLRWGASVSQVRRRSLVDHVRLFGQGEIGLRGHYPTLTGTTLTSHPPLVARSKRPRPAKAAAAAGAKSLQHIYRHVAGIGA